MNTLHKNINVSTIVFIFFLFHAFNRFSTEWPSCLVRLNLWIRYHFYKLQNFIRKCSLCIKTEKKIFRSPNNYIDLSRCRFILHTYFQILICTWKIALHATFLYNLYLEMNIFHASFCISKSLMLSYTIFLSFSYF